MTDEELLTKTYDQLYRLGLVASYAGFFHISYAVFLAAKQPKLLTAATKWLYPKVADHYDTSWGAVERNIRYSIGILWKEHPNRLCGLAGRLLGKPPSPTRFIALLAAELQA